MVVPEPYAGFRTAVMSQSSVHDSLVKNPVGLFILPTSGCSAEEEDELEDVQEHESEDDDQEELEDSRDMREAGPRRGASGR